MVHVVVLNEDPMALLNGNDKNLWSMWCVSVFFFFFFFFFFFMWTQSPGKWKRQKPVVNVVVVNVDPKPW